MTDTGKIEKVKNLFFVAGETPKKTVPVVRSCVPLPLPTRLGASKRLASPTVVRSGRRRPRDDLSSARGCAVAATVRMRCFDLRCAPDVTRSSHFHQVGIFDGVRGTLNVEFIGYKQEDGDRVAQARAAARLARTRWFCTTARP